MTTPVASPDVGDIAVQGPSRGLTPTVSAALFVEAMNVSVTAIAIPNMQADLGVPLSLLQWTHGAFIIGFAGLLLLGGRIADLFGRRRVFLISLGVFGAAALAAGLAPTLSVLFGARALQGAAAAFMIPAAVSTLTETFPEGPARNRALGAFNAAGAAGFSAGLIFGGLVIETLDWRWSFGLNAPAAFVILAIGMVTVPRSVPAGPSHRLDLAGAALISLAVTLATVAFTLTAEHGLSVGVIAALFAAIAALVAFVRVETKHPNPLLPISIFRLAGVARANIGSAALLGAFFGFNLLASVALQERLGLSPGATGLALLPMGVLCAIIAQAITPRLIDRFGAAVIAVIGLGSVSLATGGLAFMAEIAGTSVIVLSSILAGGIGMGLAYAALAVAAINGVPRSEQGVAAGLQQTALQVGGVLGTALAVLAAEIGGVGAGLATGAMIALVGVAAILSKGR